MVNPIPGKISADETAENPSSLHGIARRLAQSFAIYGAANFGTRALNFLLILIFSHYLRPSDFGIIYMAEIIASFLILFGNLSTDSSLQRLYFQYSGEPTELRRYLGTAIRFGIAACIVLLAFTLLFGKYVQDHLTRHVDVPFYPYVAMAITTAVAIQGVQYRLAVYQAQRRPLMYALFAFLLFIATAACTFYSVVVLQHGAIGMLKAKLVAAVVVFVAATWSMRTLMTVRFEWRYVRESLAFGLPLVPHQVMAGGLIVADRFILEHYRNLNEVGIYSLAYTFGMIMFLVTQSLSQAWLPMFFDLAREEGNRRVLGRICSGLVVALVAIACLGILLSPSFIHIALDFRYRAAMRIVPLVIMGYLFHALFSLLHLSIMQAKRTRFVFLISLMAFAMNMILNFALIPRWGMYGAAWATTLAYGVEALGAYIFAQHFFRLPYRLPELAGSIAVCGAALCLTQSIWISAWRGLIPVIALFVSLIFLGFMGGRDLRTALAMMGKGRKISSQVTN